MKIIFLSYSATFLYSGFASTSFVNMVSELSDSTMASSIATTTKNNPKTFKSLLFVKLNDENYLLWKQQVKAAIHGHNLLHFLEESSNPPRFLSNDDENSTNINTDYLEWEQQDQLLVSWLMSSMSEGVLARMVGCDSSSQIWTKLNALLCRANHSKGITTENSVAKYQEELPQHQ